MSHIYEATEAASWFVLMHDCFMTERLLQLLRSLPRAQQLIWHEGMNESITLHVSPSLPSCGSWDTLISKRQKEDLMCIAANILYHRYLQNVHGPTHRDIHSHTHTQASCEEEKKLCFIGWSFCCWFNYLLCLPGRDQGQKNSSFQEVYIFLAA